MTRRYVLPASAVGLSLTVSPEARQRIRDELFREVAAFKDQFWSHCR